MLDSTDRESMSRNLIQCLKDLEVIAKIKDPRVRRSVLRGFASNLALYDALREVAANTIKRKVPLNSAQKKKLRRHEKILKSIASKQRKSKKRKQELIVQSGGWVQTLIPVVSALVAALT